MVKVKIFKNWTKFSQTKPLWKDEKEFCRILRVYKMKGRIMKQEIIV